MPMLDLSRPHIARQLARLPGLITSGITVFDDTLTFPIPPVDIEKLYGAAALWSEVADQFADCATRAQINVIVGAESAGIPLAAAIALRAALPCGYVRKPGYKGHVANEPSCRGASLEGRRIMLVDDALWTGASLDAFANSIGQSGGILTVVAAVIDMRELAPLEWAKRTDRFKFVDVISCCSYYELLQGAMAEGVISNRAFFLIRSFIEESWMPDHPLWNELNAIEVVSLEP
jgi:orotate phosphoribosyltransferase